MKNKTLENFGSGLLGKVCIGLGIILLFVNPIIGIVVICLGAYLKYKSSHYVHLG